ncbi:hypothetical protein TWF281_011778 [Arthrobotrys megalospora]
MCTDYEVWYACGHQGHLARPDASNANEQGAEVYAGCTSTAPTARVVKHCSQFELMKAACPIQDRLVVTQRWEIVCFDNDNCKPIDKFDDDNCPLLQQSLESSAAAGQRYLDSLSEKERAELYKTSARISQPPVWGRKGPHIKKPRKVKTKEERERDKEEKSRTKAQKEAEKAEKKELAAARALTDLASGRPKGGRKKAVKNTDLQEVNEKPKGRKRKAEVVKVDEKPEPMKRKKPSTAESKGEAKSNARPAAKNKTNSASETKGKGRGKAVDTEDQPSKPASRRQREKKLV